MKKWYAVKRWFTPNTFREYVKDLVSPAWVPDKKAPAIVWRHANYVSADQWINSGSEDTVRGLVPGRTCIENMETALRKGGDAAPHLCIAPPCGGHPGFIWVFNRLTEKSFGCDPVHRSAFFIDMIAGLGDNGQSAQEVYKNCIFATAILCMARGIKPSPVTISCGWNIENGSSKALMVWQERLFENVHATIRETCALRPVTYDLIQRHSRITIIG